MYLYLSVILFVTSSVLTKITNPYDSSCSYNEFECGDGSCVSIDRVCNGIEDCSGAEDETVCSEIPAKFGLHSSRRRRQTSNCKKSEWRCRDGTCISFDGKCDGVVDCPDSSDETHALCGKTTCQSNWFRCTYGACVDGTAPCNGIQECADNSDELLPQCRGNEVADATNLRDKFKCADGNVIPATAFCDGVADCPDGSDETVQACAGRTCPAYLFQCAYGACVDAGSDCNGIKECADGSDESDELCDRVLSGKPTQKPSASGGCVLPQYPAHGSYVVLNTPNATPGQTFDSIQVNVTCKPGYGVMGRNDVFCLNGWWSDKLPQCVRFCTLNSHASVEYKCLLTNGNEGTRPCGSLEPTGTIVQPQCRSPNYYSTVPLGYMRCIEGNWDYVATCTPGLSRNGTNVTVLIRDKVEIYISNLEYTVSVGAGIGKGDDSKGDNGDVIGKGDGKGDNGDHDFNIDEGDWRIAPAKVNKKVKPLMVDFVNSTKDKIYFRD